MEQGSKYILLMLMVLLAGSCFHFISLFAGLPVAVPAVLTAAAAVLLYLKIVPVNTLAQGEIKVTSWVALAVYTICVAVLTQKVLATAKKYGEWDAWAIWNYHARFLTSHDHWRNVFLNQENDHPDYPLGLPSAVAFVWRMTGSAAGFVAPFAIALFTTLATPTLIFSEFYKKNLTVATLGLMLFAGNTFFIHIGVAQYADPLLGLFFLAAIVSLDHVTEHPVYVAVAAACIGGCVWIKNEGLILAVLTMVFYGHLFFSRRYIKLTIAGIALPLITWVLFRSCVLSANDLVDGLNGDTWKKLFDSSRYDMILHQLNVNMHEHFPYLKGLAIFYLLACLLRRKRPDRQMLLVGACLLAYMSIYIVTRHDLEWHLVTSQNRLLLQLMPAFIYALSVKFGGRPKLNYSQFSFRQM